MKKPREPFFAKYLAKTYDIGKMLHEQGKTDAERSAFELITSILLFIELHLRRIALVSFVLLGFVFSKFLSSLF